MRVICNHGYFKFYPDKKNELSRFNSLFRTNLVKPLNSDYFTFPRLADLPKYSLKGKPYLDQDAEFTFEGEPWDVMRKNNIVYNFSTGESELKDNVSKFIRIIKTRFDYFDQGMIIAGSNSDNGRILSFTAFTDLKGWYYYDYIEVES